MSLVNKNINGYDITKLLGQGAFGEVYIGEKKSIKYVLKFIKITQGLDKNNQYKNNVLSIISEIYALKKITENNEKCTLSINNSSLCLIETFINFDSKPPTFCIVTNYLENAIELSKVIYNSYNYVLKVDDIIFIMSKLISQLTQLHHYNIVHSDIKPENIIVQTTNENEQGLKEINNVLFIDYGVSCLENCLPSGTLPYAAPEILPIIGTSDKDRLKELKNELHYNKLSPKNKNYKIYNDKYKIPFSKEDYKKTDVYSLGVAFYKLLNDRYPYPFKSDYKKPKSSRKSSNVSDESNGSDDSDEFDSQSKTEYYDYPEDVIRDFQNQMPLLNYYHKHKSLIPSDFSLSENDDINVFLNKIVDNMLTLNPLKRPTISQIKTTFDSFKKEISLERKDVLTPRVNNLLNLNTSSEKLFSLNTFRLNSPSSGSLLKLNDPPIPKKRNSSVNLSESPFLI